MKENVKVSTSVLNRVRKQVKKTRQTVGGFYDIAAENKLKQDAYHPPASLREAVFQALGEASMCWSQRPKGIFNSTRATEIGEELLLKIAQFK